jgi:DNA repair protein RadA/Sms
VLQYNNLHYYNNVYFAEVIIISKLKSVYECNECGEQHTKWQGKCNACNSWNSLTEVVATKPTRYTALNQSTKVVDLNTVTTDDLCRIKSEINELDMVLGGGFAHGSVVLLGGDPGIGKSTLLLQIMNQLSQKIKILYVTGEESINQIALRGNRIGLKSNSNLRFMAEIDLQKIIHTITQEKCQIVVIDSIQTIYNDLFQSAPGSVSQVRECASSLTRVAKQTGVIMIMVGHVTKDGSIAGPRVLEHIVDTVLYFEGETHSNFRLLRSIKNRFGAVNEIGVFAMTDKGLKEVNNPSALFLSSYRTNVAGSAILITQEGSRPILLEIQALVDKSYVTPAKRLAVGMDGFRLSMLIAILQRTLGVQLYDQDIFINIVGGVKVIEPALDVAVIVAIMSSFKNKPLYKKIAVFGEVGLSGEIRPVQKGQERIKEAVRLGFECIIVPTANLPKEKYKNVDILPVTDINQVISYCFKNS